MLPAEILKDIPPNGNFDNFLFYDCEVFARDNMAVFKDINKNTVASYIDGNIIDNECETLQELIDGKILVGFNNYNYDDYIISAMIATPDNPYRIKLINDEIIGGHKPSVAVNSKICSLDCYQQMKYRSGLKKIEANIGQSIEETPVDFDKPERLSIDEMETVYQYCSRDVDATVDVFKMRLKEYFVPKLALVSMLPEEMQERFLRYNTTTVTAQVIMPDKKAAIWSGRRFGKGVGEDFTLPMFEHTPDEVIDMWKSGSGKSIKNYSLGCEFVFGSGGLHGVSDKPVSRQFWESKGDSRIVLLDVASMYPNIIINTEALGKSTKAYSEIVERRLRIKKSDPVQATALKLIVNATYGLMKNEYSKLYNPPAAESVCIYGQAALYELCHRLHGAGYEIINANTDGVCFYGTPDLYPAIREQWERDFGLTLEETRFETWTQRDVNNYVAKTVTGGVKTKGGDLIKYSDPTDYKGDLLNGNPGLSWSGTNTCPIVSKAMVEYLVYGKPIEDTIVENMGNPLLFQIVLQPGNTFKGVVDTEGNSDYQRVNRVFASRTGVRLMKERYDGKTNEFPDMPEHMMVYNKDLDGFTGLMADGLNLDYYRDMVAEKLSKWPDPHIS